MGLLYFYIDNKEAELFGKPKDPNKPYLLGAVGTNRAPFFELNEQYKDAGTKKRIETINELEKLILQINLGDIFLVFISSTVGEVWEHGEIIVQEWLSQGIIKRHGKKRYQYFGSYNQVLKPIFTLTNDKMITLAAYSATLIELKNKIDIRISKFEQFFQKRVTEYGFVIDNLPFNTDDSNQMWEHKKMLVKEIDEKSDSGVTFKIWSNPDKAKDTPRMLLTDWLVGIKYNTLPKS
ncbi:MAG: hypothetical protein HeimC2_25320, partial [Candidatus Heimdallarchaeota archaeon LC_2]